MESIQSLDEIMALFGDEEARENFLQLCRNYRKEVISQKQANLANKGVTSKRSFFHNQIMEIVRRIWIQANPHQKPPTRKDIKKLILDGNLK